MYKFAVTTSLDAHSSWCVWGGAASMSIGDISRMLRRGSNHPCATPQYLVGYFAKAWPQLAGRRPPANAVSRSGPHSATCAHSKARLPLAQA